jgi:hypothetical protein
MMSCCAAMMSCCAETIATRSRLCSWPVHLQHKSLKGPSLGAKFPHLFLYKEVISPPLLFSFPSATY